GVEDDADFKAIEEEDEIPLVRRQNGVVIDLKMEKKKRMQKDYESSKKIKIKLAHQRKGEESVKEEVVDGETIHDVEIEGEESVKEEVVDGDDPSQADANIPKCDSAEKDLLMFKDMMGSVVDFTKFIKNYLKKDKITKADHEEPAFKLLKGKHNVRLMLLGKVDTAVEMTEEIALSS
nr:hypothetical protein [Tanacetum cinerariifolium]